MEEQEKEAVHPTVKAGLAALAISAGLYMATPDAPKPLQSVHGYTVPKPVIRSESEAACAGTGAGRIQCSVDAQAVMLSSGGTQLGSVHLCGKPCVSLTL